MSIYGFPGAPKTPALRVTKVADGPIVWPDCDNTDLFMVTGLTQNLLIQPPTGTPAEGQTLEFAIRTAGNTSFSVSWTNNAGNNIPYYSPSGGMKLPTRIEGGGIYLHFVFRYHGTQGVSPAAWSLLARSDGLISPRAYGQGGGGTVTIDASNVEVYELSFIASTLTVANPTGNPITGQIYRFRFSDNGTQRAINWGTNWRALGIPLPTSTSVGSFIHASFVYNSSDGKFDLITSSQSPTDPYARLLSKPVPDIKRPAADYVTSSLPWKIYTGAGVASWNSTAWSPELGLFACVADSGTNRIMTSPDGKTWTPRTAPSVSSWSGLTWSPQLRLFVAPSYSGTNLMMTSPDGVTWTAQTVPISKLWLGIAWSAELGRFAVVSSESSGDNMTSTDGITWTAYANLPGLTVSRSVIWVRELGMFVAVGFDSATNLVGKTATSYDGIFWTARTNNSKPWNGVAWSPELKLLVSVGATASGTSGFATSPDGITWTAGALGVGAAGARDWHSVVWAAELGLFVAVAQTGTGGRLMYSADGTNWTWSATNTSADSNWGGYGSGLCWSPQLGVFVTPATGSVDQVMVSPTTRMFSPYNNTPLALAIALGCAQTSSM